MGLKLAATSGGSIELVPTNTASDFTVTVPAGTGTVAVNGVSSNIVSGTAQASTSGTSIDFTSIPSWVKRVTVMFAGVSTNGSSNPIIQLGAGSVTTSGYVGASSECGATTAAASYTTGFAIRSGISTNTIQGGVVLYCLSASSYVWVASGVTSQPSNPFTHQVAGTVTLGGTLDRVRITTVGGTDTFDAGSINILYE
jgi:hypothetical protein